MNAGPSAQWLLGWSIGKESSQFIAVEVLIRTLIWEAGSGPVGT